ncbi:hypothetical protein [Algoriphagus terrigena]|uniref:hypothetical protein n=1 Tax=Algoriphagus terrigena TaxID=344884 RepID=UPI0004197216|nr:hypothetical protein [Algoriphagus terrigena]
MKTILILTCILLCLSGCVDNLDIDVGKSIEKQVDQPLDTEDGKDFTIEKFGDSESQPEALKVMPAGSQLTYNSATGIWYGHFEGSGVYFYGPTPSQLQSGMQSVWQAAPGPICPGCSVSGDGDFFTVQQPGCMAGTSISNIAMVYRQETQATATSPSKIYWYIVERNKVRMNGTDCQFIFHAKIVIDEQCKPVIVVPESDSNSACSSSPYPEV